MNTLFGFRSACVALSLMTAGSSLAADVFSGIYSVVNPANGAEVDVLKIRKYPDGYGVFSYLGGDEVQRGSISVVDAAVDGSSPQVRALPLLGEGNLYFVPKGTQSPLGPADTGYISDLAFLGKLPLKRRLLSEEPERGINGIHRYAGLDGEVPASVRVLNYSTVALQLGVSSFDNKDNAVDTDPVNGNMASAFNCCFYLPGKWSATQKVNIEIRSPAGTLVVTPVTVPKYENGNAHQFEVAVNPDGRVEILFQRSERERPLPKPSGMNK